MDTSLIDLEMVVIEIDVNIREKVLKPAQIRYLWFSNNALSIMDHINSVLLYLYYLAWSKEVTTWAYL